MPRTGMQFRELPIDFNFQRTFTNHKKLFAKMMVWRMCYGQFASIRFAHQVGVVRISINFREFLHVDTLSQVRADA